MKIAVLLTCFNRRELTLACLRRLDGQVLGAGVESRVFLVDDGSTDGTAEAVRTAFEGVRLIRGTGHLYWGGGTRLAWQTAAAEDDYDGYLWLNDDSMIEPDAVARLLTTLQQVGGDPPRCIVVGRFVDPETRQVQYGGWVRGALCDVANEPTPCEQMNGNLVLVPRSVYAELGELSKEFVHNGGDIDYSLRARKRGIGLWVAPGVAGTCRSNPKNAWYDPSVPLVQRWRAMQSPKGQPLKSTYVMYRRHYGWMWPLRLVRVLLIVLLPGPYIRLRAIFR
jgi:GT2 family glycosyltransferase